MVKDRDLAIRLVNSLLDAYLILDNSARLVRESKESDKREKKYCEFIGFILAQILSEGIQQLVNEHPDIAPKGFKVMKRKKKGSTKD